MFPTLLYSNTNTHCFPTYKYPLLSYIQIPIAFLQTNTSTLTFISVYLVSCALRDSIYRLFTKQYIYNYMFHLAYVRIC